MLNSDLDDLWVLFTLQNQLFGLSAHKLTEVTRLESTSAIPRSPDYVRGAVNLRGKIFPVLDTRKILEFRSLEEELSQLSINLKQRKQDHINWVRELISCVENNREFKLATDPHKCAFGKWYDHFRADDPIINMKLLSFDKPHKRIHGIAEQAIALGQAGDGAKAIELIEKTRSGDLRHVENLFDELIPMLMEASKEVMLVYTLGERSLGLAVDSASEVRRIPAGSVQPIEASGDLAAARSYMTGTAQLNDGRLAMLLNIDYLTAIGDAV